MKAQVLFLAALMGAPSSALAARHEISFEFSNSFLEDGALRDRLSVRGLPSPGLRAGGAVWKRPQSVGLVVGASWHRGQRVAGMLGATDTADRLVFQTLVDTFGVGVKLDYEIRSIVYPYLRADAELQLVTARLDDDNGTSDNTNQLVYQGLAPAGRFTGGLEVVVPGERWGWPVTVAFHLEGGYEVAGDASLSDLGKVNTSGGILAFGTGLRF